MIAKITSGSGFGGTERYIEDYNGRDNKIVEELDHKGVDIRIGRDGQVFKGSEVDRKLSCGRIQKFYDNRQSIFGNNGSSGNNNFNSLPNQAGKDKLDEIKDTVVLIVDAALTAIEQAEYENARAQNADRMLMQQAQRHRRTYHY